MTRAHKKSIIVTAAVCALVGICGTVAYYTDEDDQVNTLSVGSVDVEVLEDFTPAQAVNIVPTQMVAKAPYVANTSTVPTYIFLEVTVPKVNLITANTDGTKNAKRVEQLFTFTSTAAGTTTISKNYTNNTYNSKWKLLTGTGTSDFTSTTENKYVFAYNNGNPTPATTTQTEKLFDVVKLSNAVEGQEELLNETFSIDVKTYAIQSEGCSNATDAYRKYVMQNS